MKALRFLIFFLVAFLGHSPAETPLNQQSIGEGTRLEKALQLAKENRSELSKALESIPPPERSGLEFLLENMPSIDLQSLPASFLLENVSLAYLSMATAPWARQIPTAIFFNNVLPYASLNERRDSWRALLREVSGPIVADAKTPTEAALALNKHLFSTLKVRYSTKRKKPDQSPLESIESGLASCSGLAILLVDACRSVGVPARVVGTPLWTNLRGNHTWVEIWDGDWHFLGAAESDPQGLDRGWFKGDASRAQRDSPAHAIYASSFQRTDLNFPLVWNLGVDWVSAVNVTDRYTAQPPAPQAAIRFLLRVLDHRGQRVAAQSTITDPANANLQLQGVSRDEAADLNNLLTFPLAPNHTYHLEIQYGGRSVTRTITTTAHPGEEETLTVSIPN